MGTARFSLLRILADGETHSRERIGRAMALSPIDVSALVRELADLGLRVVSTGNEIRLEERVDLLDARLLAGRLRRNAPALRLELTDECDSTNTQLVARAKAGAAHGTVLACEHQAAGRGRRGNAWVSAVGGSVTFSMLWRFGFPGALAGLSLAVAVGAAEALENLGARNVMLKWPNDLLSAEGKLGGVLIETAGDATGSVAAVIGVGVNVRLHPTARARIGHPVADLVRRGEPEPSRTDVLAELLARLSLALEVFSREGFSPFRQAWLRRHAWRGRQVVLVDAGRRVAEGEVVGIAEDGALELDAGRGVERFHSGELSLRLG
jgi:BirA family biotin operon repressor/biotin-[acetyl-CoA-carboxylase] ligase